MICGTDVGRLTTESFSRESFRLGRLCIEVWRQATILEALFSSFGRMPFFFFQRGRHERMPNVACSCSVSSFLFPL
jgi:hypothetical protein